MVSVGKWTFLVVAGGAAAAGIGYWVWRKYKKDLRKPEKVDIRF